MLIAQSVTITYILSLAVYTTTHALAAGFLVLSTNGPKENERGKKKRVHPSAVMRLYLGEELDAVANPDEVHLVVEPEDVHPGPRAAGVEDHGVPPRPSRRRRRINTLRGLVGVVYDEEARLSTKHRIGKDHAAGLQEEEEEEHYCHRRCHCCARLQLLLPIAA